MNKFSDGDPQYLRDEQYVDGSKLGDRMNLHDRFSINPQGWHRWVFEQLALMPGAQVLEAACGTGALWAKNADRLPDGMELTVTDFSAGMVDTTADALTGIAGIRSQVADVQDLPFADDSYDVVVCNHALYHVPDRARAAAELRRVLRPGGLACVATNGMAHLTEFQELRRRHVPDEPIDDTSEVFGLETGEEQLATAFDSIECRRYDDGLRVTEVEPLLAFLLSTPMGEALDEPARAALTGEIERVVADNGHFAVTKDAGLFLCR
ncbi:MAG: class I SAM-dependent methyltransferase [Acidimicrobiales bacterium]